METIDTAMVADKMIDGLIKTDKNGIIISPVEELRKANAVITDEKELDSIIFELEETLRLSGGIGLAAPQIGIHSQVAIIRMPGVLEQNIVNPSEVTISKDCYLYYKEGCLSFPGKNITTVRRNSISFLNKFKEQEEKCVFSIGSAKVNPEQARTITAAVQHEIDHLFGILMFDRQRMPIVVTNHIGRNDDCKCGSGKKYKKCCGK